MFSIEQKKILLVSSNKKIRDSYIDKFISHFQNTGKGDIDLTWATHDCRGWKDENFHRLFHYETGNPNPFKEWVKKEIFSKVISHGGKRRCPLILQDAQPELCLSTLEAIVDVCREAVDSTAMPFFIVSIDTVSAEYCTPYLIGNFESIWITDLNKAYIPDELCYIPKIPVNGGNRCSPKKLDWTFAEKHINWPWRQTSKATEIPSSQPWQGEVPGAGVKKQNPKLVLRTSENKVYWEGKEEGLSPKPYQLLYVLALTPGELIPYGRMKWLISADTANLPKALSKHISSIKARIPALKNIIHNTEDLGYELRLKKEDVLVQGKIAEVDTLLQLD